MTDAWETLHEFDPSNPADGLLDADGDGYSNLEEFVNGTDPHGDDPHPGQIVFSQAAYTVAEDAGSVTVTVERTIQRGWCYLSDLRNE